MATVYGVGRHVCTQIKEGKLGRNMSATNVLTQDVCVEVLGIVVMGVVIVRLQKIQMARASLRCVSHGNR